jgi:hypothetical protein
MELTDQDPAPARMRGRAATALLAAAAALAFAGCGSDKKDTATTTAGQTSPPVATAPSATTPPADATPATGPDAVTTTPESQQGGAGDEGGIRVQSSLLLDNGKVVPTVVRVPAFLPIEMVVVSVEGFDRKLTVDTKGGEKQSLEIPALKRRTLELPGLPKGDHAIYIDGKPMAKLDVGSEPAP